MLVSAESTLILPVANSKAFYLQIIILLI